MQDRTDIDIKAIRDELDMSQTAFAKAIGVDQSTVCVWEKKGLPKNKMTLDSLSRRVAELRQAAAA